MSNTLVKKLLIRYSRLMILIAIFVFFSCVTTTFWRMDSWDNVANIVFQQAPFVVLLAICMTVSIVLKGFDLSIGSSIALISCIVGYILKWTYNPALAIGIALFCGMAIGAMNGILIAKVRISPFIATYAMRWILRGLALVILGGHQIYDFGTRFRPLFISSKYTFFAIAAGICLAVGFLLNRTIMGKYIYATGTNVDAARISGIRTDGVIITAYIATGVILGITSVMYIANLGTAEPVIGESFALTAIAASLVGGTAVSGGKGGVYNAIVGSLIMLILSNGMIQIGIPAVWQQVVIGGVIIVSIVIEKIIQLVSIDVS